ncbi:MAG: type II toxin-antitoxin system Phd/YefM family antitoxin [Waterburya sp.]
MINLSRDIQSLSTFKRNTNEIIKQMKATGSPLVLTVNGKAELVVQEAEAYQKLLDKIDRLETLVGKRKELTEDTSSSNLLDLYSAAADIEFAVDDRGICDEMDDDLTSAFDE